MASIHYETLVDVPVEKAWAAVRDVGAAHHLFAGVLTDASLKGAVRTVTFANGMVVRERIVDLDDVGRRVAYTVLDGVFEHHSASMQIFVAKRGAKQICLDYRSSARGPGGDGAAARRARQSSNEAGLGSR